MLRPAGQEPYDLTGVQYLPTTSHIAHMHPVLTTHATTAGALASDPPHHNFMDLMDH